MAYDGFLSGCLVWMDTDGDRTPSLGEEQTLVRRGSFVLGTAQPSGTLRIVPASVSGNLTQARARVGVRDQQD